MWKNAYSSGSRRLIHVSNDSVERVLIAAVCWESGPFISIAVSGWPPRRRVELSSCGDGKVAIRPRSKIAAVRKKLVGDFSK